MGCFYLWFGVLYLEMSPQYERRLLAGLFDASEMKVRDERLVVDYGDRFDELYGDVECR